MIVVDTNILAYSILDQADPSIRRQAAKVLQGQVLLPPLWRHEFLNMLANYAKAKLMSLSAAEDYWHQAVAIAQEAEAEVDMVRALELADELGISAYDAEFVALAEGADTILVTEDRRLRTAAGALAMSMKEFLAL